LPARLLPLLWCCLAWDDDGALCFPASLAGLNDSKQISEGLRDQLFAELCQIADVSIASVSATTIDARNIRKASLEAMRLAVLGLPEPASFALVDGKDEPPGLPCAATAIIKGDGRSLLHCGGVGLRQGGARPDDGGRRPAPSAGYDFATHKGYPTEVHREALAAAWPLPAAPANLCAGQRALMGMDV
jgi:ribonuclease HII